MNLIDFVRESVELQVSLNNKYHGSESWREDVPRMHFEIAFADEFSELMTSIPRLGVSNTGWKFWRLNLENDIQNAMVELVDMYHFGLSIVLYTKTPEEIAEKLEDIVDSNFNVGETATEQFEIFVEGYKNFLVTGDCVVLMEMVLNGCRMIDKEFEDFCSVYRQKNDINLKRILGGYKHGEYQKVDENGNEDNRSIKV